MRIVIDSSAFISILLKESDSALFLSALMAATGTLVSSVNLFETRTVLQARKGPVAVAEFEALIRELGAEIVGFGSRSADDAFSAYRRFGKGFHSKARLNLGDCAAYALSKATGVPLLFKGDDFHHTDVTPALPLLVPEAGGRSI